MAVELNRETCAQCGVRLTDRSSIVEDDGTLYCCGNCLAHAGHPEIAVAPNQEFCANCGLSLFDESNRVRRGVKVYCCNNCANAMEREIVGRPTQV